MTKEDETVLIVANFGIQSKIGKEVFEARNTERPESVRAALDDAAWRGFCAGLEAVKKFYETK